MPKMATFSEVRHSWPRQMRSSRAAGTAATTGAVIINTAVAAAAAAAHATNVAAGTTVVGLAVAAKVGRHRKGIRESTP